MSLRVGVAGVGRLGREHARILGDLPGCELHGVHDVDPGRGEAVARRHGTVHRQELEALLERVDALVVAVPTAAHHAVTRQAVDAGVHVLVEKPLCTTLEEADDLIRRAEEAGVRLLVGHVERFNPAVRAGLPYLSEPRFLASQRLAPFQPRGTDVSVLLDLMIHDVDLVLGLVDSPVADVQAVGVPVLTDSVDMANARLLFENGAVADISASRVSMERTRALRVFQASGYLSLDLAEGRGEFLRRRPGPPPGGKGDPPSLEAIVERIPLQGDDREPLRLELEAFRDGVLDRGERCVTGREARAALEVVLRIGREIERFSHVTAPDS